MRSKTLACLFTLAALLSGHVQAAEQQVQISEPIARAMPAVAPTSAVFLTVHNTGTRDRVLVGASSSAARQVELHTHSMQDGVMAMRRVPQVELPAGGTVVFQPGGLHIMLIGLNHALEDGKQIDLTLEFADGESLSLQVPVGQPGMGGQGHEHHHQMH